MLFQLCDQSDFYYTILSNFYVTHRHSAQNPSNGTFSHFLHDILELAGQAPIFLIVDALDEGSNTSDIPSSHEKALVLVEKLIEPQLPNLRICVTSRPEGDIKSVSRTINVPFSFPTQREGTNGGYRGLYQVSR